MLNWLSQLDYYTAFSLFLIENGLIAFVSITLGNLIIKRFAKNNVIKTNQTERLLLVSSIFFNTIITFLGFWLWRNGYIIINVNETIFSILLDFLVLFLVMDVLMYFLHRIAHAPFIYRWLHATHHTFKEPRPIDLYALNPLEDIAFGLLWIGFIMVYSCGFTAMITYLTVNVIFGIMGHLGFEPVSEKNRTTWWYSLFCFSAFHHRHHLEDKGNYGFYTTIWDRLLGTLKI